jgi:hypothetical protein
MPRSRCLRASWQLFASYYSSPPVEQLEFDVVFLNELDRTIYALTCTETSSGTRREFWKDLMGPARNQNVINRPLHDLRINSPVATRS